MLNLIKVALSPTPPKKYIYIYYFLFHLKSYFRSQDIQVSVLTFWACRKNDLMRNIRLLSSLVNNELQ